MSINHGSVWYSNEPIVWESGDIPFTVVWLSLHNYIVYYKIIFLGELLETKNATEGQKIRYYTLSNFSCWRLFQFVHTGEKY